MTLNHVHLQVRDLPAAVHWFALVLELKPGFQNERIKRITTFILGVMTIIIDAGPVDSPATLGFESDDCDRDFEMVVSRGAVSIEAPVNKEWGVRTAYFKGPGAIKCEIEGPVVTEQPA
jgi:catechol 2,3-dioxygenase-like lactoylglutathione lyase family enzyme